MAFRATIMVRALVSILVAFLSTILSVIAQDRPTQGYELSDPDSGIDIVLPSSMTQCDPFLIYYSLNTTTTFYIAFYTPDLQGDALLTLQPPLESTGYIDWICDIPAGLDLVVATRLSGVLYGQYYTVEPGTSSACLGALTTTYSILNYGMNFPSYTAATTSYVEGAFDTVYVCLTI
jgi:hypothetical protein